jgi:hypothetical protein
MKINLFTCYYKDKDADRANELSLCLKKNLSAGFDKIHILTENAEHKRECIDIVLQNNSCAEVINFNSRPSFNDFFNLMKEQRFASDINVLSNSDIYFEDLQQIKNIMSNPSSKRMCLALSRWDVQPNGSAVHFNRWDSQDTWIFYGSPEINTAENYTMGIAGCDNKLAYELELAGYNVSNPSCTIKTFHYHLSNIRNYINGDVIERVPPPYKLVNPI